MKLPKIDKDRLIWALEDNSGMATYYLDVETGRIVSTFDDDLIGSGLEKEDLESERFWYIDPVRPWEAYNLMVEFIETAKDQELKRRLSIASDGRGAFRMFKATLSEYPEEQERWFRFHDTKMEEYADEWLKNVALTLKSKE